MIRKLKLKLKSISADSLSIRQIQGNDHSGTEEYTPNTSVPAHLVPPASAHITLDSPVIKPVKVLEDPVL
jgi:hypothetical protein